MFVAAFAKHMIHRIPGRVAVATTGCVMLLVITLAAATLGGPLPTPLPLFPSDNWWNVDVSDAPIDPASSNFISFINNGSTRRLHPDFGGEASLASDQIYGFPYIVVGGSQAKRTVQFRTRMKATESTTRPIEVFLFTRSPMRQSLCPTGLKAANPATAIYVRPVTATSSSLTGTIGTSTNCSTRTTTAPRGTLDQELSST
jgi:hypothetical protein